MRELVVMVTSDGVWDTDMDRSEEVIVSRPHRFQSLASLAASLSVGARQKSGRRSGEEECNERRSRSLEDQEEREPIARSNTKDQSAPLMMYAC